MFGLSAKPPSGRYLSFAEREEISLLRVQGCSMHETARQLWTRRARVPWWRSESRPGSRS
nr:helix-turn-helix domain-containing protein [Lichenicola cladoniae]